MINFRDFGVTHAYLDEKLDGFSNFGIGLLIRAMGHSLKVAYVDVGGGAGKFTNFIENLSLNYSFVKSFDRMHVEMFSFKSYDRISKVIIPLVEFNTIDRKIFFNSLRKYDLVIFDNMDFNFISEVNLREIIKNKFGLSEFVFIFSKKEDFNKIKDDVDITTEYNYEYNNSLISNKNLINIYGDARGKSIYSFGFIIRNFLNKKDIKLIYFDKGDNINGEIYFFSALKKWAKLNNIYGSFDFVINGAKRFDGPRFRDSINNLDKKEAIEALMLLKTSIKTGSIIVADELGRVVNNNILSKQDVEGVLKQAKNSLLVTGSCKKPDFYSLSGEIIKVHDLKSSVSIGFKKGIDY